MYTVPEKYQPELSAAGLLSVEIDGLRFDASIEDDRLIVHGGIVDGRQVPGASSDFIVRVDTGMKISGLLDFGAQPDDAHD